MTKDLDALLEKARLWPACPPGENPDVFSSVYVSEVLLELARAINALRPKAEAFDAICERRVDIEWHGERSIVWVNDKETLPRDLLAAVQQATGRGDE